MDIFLLKTQYWLEYKFIVNKNCLYARLINNLSCCNEYFTYNEFLFYTDKILTWSPASNECIKFQNKMFN